MKIVTVEAGSYEDYYYFQVVLESEKQLPRFEQDLYECIKQIILECKDDEMYVFEDDVRNDIVLPIDSIFTKVRDCMYAKGYRAPETIKTYSIDAWGTISLKEKRYRSFHDKPKDRFTELEEMFDKAAKEVLKK